MEPFIYKIDYEIPKYKNHLNRSKNFKNILKKTGIFETYKIQNSHSVIDLAFKTCKRNLKYIKKCDTLIFVTQTPTFLLPSCSSILQGKLGLDQSVLTFDINMGCSGYIHGLSIASGLIKTKVSKNIALICADTYSNYFSKKNKNKFLFSDAASLTLIKKRRKKSIGPFLFGTDGKNFDKIIIKKNYQNDLEFNMSGSDVYLFTLNKIPVLIKKYLNMIKKNSKDFFIFHQASKIILETLKNKLEINNEKFIVDLKYGNTTSSSIPIALHRAIQKNKIKKNNRVIICGFGVGLAWGVTSIVL
ncbi:ketoacyl-ACP synthase III [Candidatus Pelagibacter sp.]|nr:ketoacyl-ACP synthase III [Candidatus Pelagibacter sp.]